MEHWLHRTAWLGNPTSTWVTAAIAAFVGYLVMHAIAALVAARLRRLAERTRQPGLEVAAGVAAATRGWLLLLIAVVIALDFLDFKAPVPLWLGRVTVALIGAQVAYWLAALAVGWVNASARRHGERPANAVMLGILTWGIQFAIWATLLLVVLSYSDVQITAFVASLGVGGVAVALALQNVLGDLFASISIGLDKPFEVGEYIAFGTEQGTVTKVGVKSTRIRSLSGEELAVANSVLLKDLIHNYSRRRERRIVFTFRLPFDTPRERLPQVVERVRGFIEAEQQVRFDRGYLSGFGDYGLDFEFVYYVLDPDYNLFVEIQQRINLKMLDAFDELDVTFAVPARRLQTGPTDSQPVVQVTATD